MLSLPMDIDFYYWDYDDGSSAGIVINTDTDQIIAANYFIISKNKWPIKIHLKLAGFSSRSLFNLIATDTKIDPLEQRAPIFTVNFASIPNNKSSKATIILNVEKINFLPSHVQSYIQANLLNQEPELTPR